MCFFFQFSSFYFYLFFFQIKLRAKQTNFGTALLLIWAPILFYVMLLLSRSESNLHSEFTTWDTSAGGVILQAVVVVWIALAMLAAINYFLSTTKTIKDFENTNEILGTPFTSYPYSETPYPICNDKVSLNIPTLMYEDLILSSQLIYHLQTREKETIANLSSYFMNDGWKIKEYTLNEPVFMHLENKQSKTDLIVIRGTRTVNDLYQDFHLFGSILLFQGISKIFPFVSMLPLKTVQGVILHMETIKNKFMQVSGFTLYYDSIQSYITQNISKNNTIVLTGHSLGGSLSHIIAGRLTKNQKLKHIYQNKIRSIGFNALSTIVCVCVFACVLKDTVKCHKKTNNKIQARCCLHCQEMWNKSNCC